MIGSDVYNVTNLHQNHIVSSNGILNGRRRHLLTGEYQRHLPPSHNTKGTCIVTSPRTEIESTAVGSLGYLSFGGISGPSAFFFAFVCPGRERKRFGVRGARGGANELILVASIFVVVTPFIGPENP